MRKGDRTKGIHRNPKKKEKIPTQKKSFWETEKKKKKCNVHNILHNFYKKL